MFKYIKCILSMSLICSIVSLYGQIAINTDNVLPDSSALLDVQSSTQGILTPRMTTLERDAILNPAEGLLLFDTDSTSFLFFSNNDWVKIGAASPSNIRSVFFSPTSFDNSVVFQNATRGKIGFTSTIDMPSGTESRLVFSIPIPEDFVSGFANIKLLYTSSDTTGNFQLSTPTRDFEEGQSIFSLNPGGGSNIIPAPSVAGQLAETTLDIGIGANPNSLDEFLAMSFRRQGQSANDTATGALRVVGWVLEYEGN